ncbi:MAG: hypothetical protein RLY14_1722 [Planctomycetota bacterium]|jgi:8-oxo-dGTP pyrophosphatase MutT (NUDIX family)
MSTAGWQSREWVQQLQERLSHGRLPGRDAQREFSPSWAYGRHFGPLPKKFFPAAVILLLYWHDGQWWFPLTKRPDTLPDHPGQISLPGGRLEGEEIASQAALRELQEELGVVVPNNQIIGQLSSLYVYSSRHQVTPFVAQMNKRPAFLPQAEEVASLLEIPVRYLFEKWEPESMLQLRGSTELRFPGCRYEENIIWGATAMMLNELHWILRTS